MAWNEMNAGSTSDPNNSYKSYSIRFDDTYKTNGIRQLLSEEEEEEQQQNDERMI